MGRSAIRLAGARDSKRADLRLPGLVQILRVHVLGSSMFRCLSHLRSLTPAVSAEGSAKGLGHAPSPSWSGTTVLLRSRTSRCTRRASSTVDADARLSLFEGLGFRVWGLGFRRRVRALVLKPLHKVIGSSTPGRALALQVAHPPAYRSILF